ncbi:MAG: lipopolysaccharide biosynthesis protein [Candidatus Rokubacteria bacterium]|nr:lipopolysaccharide biosynthesis protein [Candidatus Rokubacteria bacterium]
MRERIARSLFWLVWSRGAVQAASFLSALVVARLLNPADYGLMALAGVWIYAIALIGELGLGAAIVQFRDLDARELNACFWLVVGLGGIGYLAVYASAPTIGAWFASPKLADVLRVAGLSLPLVAVRVVPDSLLRKRLELDRVSQAEVAAMLVAIPVVVAMAWSGAGVWALVAGTLVTPLVQNIVSFWFVRWWPGLRVGSRRLREILRYSLAALGARAGWAVYQQIDAVVLGKVFGEVVLGFYSMAKLLATLPVDKVSVVANQLALPIMAGLQTDRRAMRASFLRGLRLVACLTVPLCVGMALVADDFVSVVLAEKWRPMVPLLRVLSLLGLIRSLDVLLPPVLFARYRAAFLFWWTGALLLAMPFAFWAGAVWMGPLGVALAWITVYPVIMAWMAREALRELETGWKTLRHELRTILVATLMMAGVVMVVEWALPASDVVDRLVRLVVAAGLGAAVYAASILWQGGVLVGEIEEVAGWLLRRHAAVRTSDG